MGNTAAGAAAIIFDLDDTLLDHTGAARVAVRGWLASLGLVPSDELAALWFDAEGRHYSSFARGEVSYADQRRLRLREMLTAVGRPVGPEHELDAMFDDYVSRYSKAWRPFDDIEAALSTVEARGLRIGILTNGTDRQQRAKLAAIGVDHRVGPVVCSDTSGYSKPDTRAFFAACAAVGVEPDAAVYVGDNYELDVVAARAAGLRAIHLDRSGAHPHPESERITSLRELAELLG